MPVKAHSHQSASFGHETKSLQKSELSRVGDQLRTAVFFFPPPARKAARRRARAQRRGAEAGSARRPVAQDDGVGEEGAAIRQPHLNFAKC